MGGHRAGGDTLTGKLLSPAAPSPDQEARKQPQHEGQAQGAPQDGPQQPEGGGRGRSAWGRDSKSDHAPLRPAPPPRSEPLGFPPAGSYPGESPFLTPASTPTPINSPDLKSPAPPSTPEASPLAWGPLAPAPPPLTAQAEVAVRSRRARGAIHALV